MRQTPATSSTRGGALIGTSAFEQEVSHAAAASRYSLRAGVLWVNPRWCLLSAATAVTFKKGTKLLFPP
jgi:hypothetical protein